MKRNAAILLVVAAFGSGILITWLWSRSVSAPATGVDAAARQERKVLYWHDPMVPGARFDKPGKSPFMDMDLVPVYADEQGRSSVAGGRTPGATDEAPATAGTTVTVRPEIVNSLGVRTYKVERMQLPRRTVTHGYLIAGGNNGALTAQVDIFDRDADWVRPGMPARLTVDALPGETFAGSVANVDADIGIGARTLRAAVRLARRDARLKANMFAEVVIEAPAMGAHLAVPREALIRTGQRTAVILALGEGRFQPIDVTAGRELGEFVEIRQGLKPGDGVVVSGQFLIDSEASLRAAFRRLSAPDDGTHTPAAPAGEHRH